MQSPIWEKEVVLDTLATTGTTSNTEQLNSEILKHDEIRIFNYRDKYILVGPDDTVFMMFEKCEKDYVHVFHPTIKIVDFPIKADIAKFPMATKVPYGGLSASNLAFICQAYTALNYKANPFWKRVNEIKKKYKISCRLSKVFAKAPAYANLNFIHHDFNEARFYLAHNPKCSNALQSGTKMEKKVILYKILSDVTYDNLSVDTMEKESLQDFIDELLS